MFCKPLAQCIVWYSIVVGCPMLHNVSLFSSIKIKNWAYFLPCHVASIVIRAKQGNLRIMYSGRSLSCLGNFWINGKIIRSFVWTPKTCRGIFKSYTQQKSFQVVQYCRWMQSQHRVNNEFLMKWEFREVLLLLHIEVRRLEWPERSCQTRH